MIRHHRSGFGNTDGVAHLFALLLFWAFFLPIAQRVFGRMAGFWGLLVVSVLIAEGYLWAWWIQTRFQSLVRDARDRRVARRPTLVWSSHRPRRGRLVRRLRL